MWKRERGLRGKQAAAKPTPTPPCCAEFSKKKKKKKKNYVNMPTDIKTQFRQLQGGHARYTVYAGLIRLLDFRAVAPGAPVRAWSLGKGQLA